LQHDVRPYVAACDVMALCSLTETFSLAALEAMAMGKPVIHSELGGAAEMIVPGRNGFLFPAGDTRALVQRLALLAERALRERMGNEARAVVKSLFSEKVMVDRYERLLLELCGARPAAATVQAQALHQTAEVK
jgi:L-malate glycosyltransferase